MARSTYFSLVLFVRSLTNAPTCPFGYALLFGYALSPLSVTRSLLPPTSTFAFCAPAACNAAVPEIVKAVSPCVEKATGLTEQAACALKHLCPALIYPGHESGKCTAEQLLAYPDQEAVLAVIPIKGVTTQQGLDLLLPICPKDAPATGNNDQGLFLHVRGGEGGGHYPMFILP